MKTYLIEAENLYTSGLYKYMIIESLITVIGPQVFTASLKYSEYNHDNDVTIEYNVNELLCCFVWIKLYACIRTFLLSNKYTEPRA